MDRPSPLVKGAMGQVEYAGGACMPIVGRTQYVTLTGTANEETEIVLAKYVDTLAFVSGVIVCRYYEKGSFPTNATAKVVVQNVSFAEDEPQTVFADEANETLLDIPQGDTPPKLYTVEIGLPIARYVRVLLRVKQPATGMAPIDITIGIDLIGRDA